MCNPIIIIPVLFILLYASNRFIFFWFMAPMAPAAVESIPQIRRMLLLVSKVSKVLIIAILGISMMIGKFLVLVPSYISVIQMWKGALPILNNIIVSMRLLFLLSRVFSKIVYLF